MKPQSRLDNALLSLGNQLEQLNIWNWDENVRTTKEALSMKQARQEQQHAQQEKPGGQSCANAPRGEAKARKPQMSPQWTRKAAEEQAGTRLAELGRADNFPRPKDKALAQRFFQGPAWRGAAPHGAAATADVARGIGAKACRLPDCWRR